MAGLGRGGFGDDQAGAKRMRFYRVGELRASGEKSGFLR